MSDEGIRSVYMTFPDQDTAAAIARALLDERLIACANLFPPARSLYEWDGEVRDEAEVVAIAKTAADRMDALVKRVRELHPYDTPCVVTLVVNGGDEHYLHWVRDQTRR
jgi:periplasmic divalent cation tolerance protein